MDETVSLFRRSRHCWMLVADYLWGRLMLHGSGRETMTSIATMMVDHHDVLPHPSHCFGHFCEIPMSIEIECMLSRRLVVGVYAEASIGGVVSVMSSWSWCMDTGL